MTSIYFDWMKGKTKAQVRALIAKMKAEALKKLKAKKDIG